MFTGSRELLVGSVMSSMWMLSVLLAAKNSDPAVYDGEVVRMLTTTSSRRRGDQPHTVAGRMQHTENRESAFEACSPKTN